MMAGHLIVHAEVELTLTEYAQATRGLLLKRFGIYPWGMAILFFGAVGSALISPSMVLGAKLALLTGVLVIILLARKGSNDLVRNTYYKNIAPECPLHFRFDMDGVTQSGKSFHVTKQWGQVRAVEFKRGLYLIHLEYGAWLLPTRVFTKEQEEQFEKLLLLTRHKRYGARH